MTLVQAWIDSIQLLKPKNLQLFVMVTLKSIVEAYKLLFKYFWWLLGLLAVCAILPYFFPRIDMPIDTDTVFGITRATFHHFVRHIVFFASCWIFELLFLFTCFITRPSIMQKNWNYFGLELKKIIIYWLFVPLFSWSSDAYDGYIFTILFFLDSEGGPKNFFLSIWYAIKMVVFNLPLVVPVGALVYGAGYLGMQCIERLLIFYGIAAYPQLYLIVNLIGGLLLPLGVCTYANIYIKKLHDQFDLYVKQPQ